MNPFARLVGRTKSARPASRPRHERLLLETLEERWTPAVSVVITNDQWVSVQDSDSGKVNNTIEIIDDYTDHNTYIKINGGPKTLLNTNAGANGKLQNLGINMAGGDDKVIFTTVGAGKLTADLERSLALGLGKDSFTLTLDKDLDGHEVAFTVWGQAGNDAYNINGGFQNGVASFDLVDHDGSDVYNVATGALVNAEFYFTLVDVNGGVNKLKFTAADMQNGCVDIDLKFNGNASNAITFVGNASFVDGAYSVNIDGGSGKETVAIDDNHLSDIESYFELELNEGNDVVTATINGRKTAGPSGVYAGSLNGLNIGLGAGDDSFTATIYGKYFQVDSQGAGMTGLGMNVDGGSGKDKLTVQRSGSTPISVSGDEGYLWAHLRGGSDDDVIKVALGTIVSGATNGAYATVKIDAGSGADKVNVSAAFGNLTGFSFYLEVVLGKADGKDSLVTKIINASGATQAPTIAMGSKITGGLDDVITAEGTFFGQKITSLVTVTLA